MCLRPQIILVTKVFLTKAFLTYILNPKVVEPKMFSDADNSTRKIARRPIVAKGNNFLAKITCNCLQLFLKF